MDKEVHKAFYGKYNGIFRACANSVYQVSSWGGGGLGTRLLSFLLQGDVVQIFGSSSVELLSNFLSQ